MNSIAVIVRSTTKNSIEEFGTPDKFLDENKNLLGAQVFRGGCQAFHTGVSQAMQRDRWELHTR